MPALTYRLRPLLSQDLPQLQAIQTNCYGAALVESTAVFERRLRSPANCSIVMESDGQVCAYLAAYWSILGNVTPLHGAFGSAPHAQLLYLHDMAVLPVLAGRGCARLMLQHLIQCAARRAMSWAALVSVQDSEAYWQRQGFSAMELQDAGQREALASYGEGAVYMVRPLTP